MLSGSYTRRALFSLGLIVLIPWLTNGQRFEITPQYGYQVGAKWNYYGGYVKLKSSDQFGLTASLNLSEDMQAEFMWAQQNTSVAIKDVVYYPREEEISDIRVNHYQFGIIYKFGYDDLVPFAGLSAGWASFNPEELGYSTNTRFSLGATGGMKYFFSDRVGLRLQAQLLMPIEWGGVYLGTGGSGVSVGGTLVQLNFSGGLVLAI